MLRHASANGKTDMIKVLLMAGLKVLNTMANTSPCCMCQEKFGEAIRLLLENEAGVKTKDKDRWTPLHLLHV